MLFKAFIVLSCLACLVVAGDSSSEKTPSGPGSGYEHASEVMSHEDIGLRPHHSADHSEQALGASAASKDDGSVPVMMAASAPHRRASVESAATQAPYDSVFAPGFGSPEYAAQQYPGSWDDPISSINSPNFADMTGHMGAFRTPNMLQYPPLSEAQLAQQMAMFSNPLGGPMSPMLGAQPPMPPPQNPITKLLAKTEYFPTQPSLSVESLNALHSHIRAMFDAALVNPAAVAYPLNAMVGLRDQVDHLFYATAATYTPLEPKADLVETDQFYEIFVDMPGVSKEDLSVKVSGNALRASGRRLNPLRFDGMFAMLGGQPAVVHQMERFFGTYSRAFVFGHALDPKDVSANYQNGVLHIRVTKPRA